jgi:hypothetical protein
MPFELPTLEEEYGVAFCVCGEPEATGPTPIRNATCVAKYKTPQGDIFIRAGLVSKPKPNSVCQLRKTRILWKHSGTEGDNEEEGRYISRTTVSFWLEHANHYMRDLSCATRQIAGIWTCTVPAD